MKIRSYSCPKCGREYNFADGNKTRLCRVCGCELDSLTVYSTDGESAEKDQASATRRENREAEEQEALFVWAEYQSAAHTELKLYTTYRMRASVVSHTVPRSETGE